MIMKWVYLAVFGAVGTIARAEVAALVQRAAGPAFPWGTVAVNLMGSFLFGLIWAASADSARGTDIRLAALTGFMGAFTTFSTFMFDTAALGQAQRFGAAAGNLVLQNTAGVALIFLGFAIGRAL